MEDQLHDVIDDILLPIDEDYPDEYYEKLVKEYEESIAESSNEDNIIDYNILVSGLVKNMAEKNLDEAGIEQTSKKLSALYEKNIRNNYFILFSAITEVSKESIESFDALNINIDNLNDYAKRTYKDNEKVLNGFDKLNQYIKLEANRASYNQVQIQKLGLATQQFENQKKDLENQKRELGNMEIRLKEYEDKLSAAESGYINNLLAVLGVFSGIIIAFFGGLEFITSVFNNIGDISKYRLVFISLLLGFIIFNTVSAMLVFLGKMIDKDIYRPCKTPDCSCDKKCGAIRKMKNKLPYVYSVNFVIIFMMIGTTCLCFLDFIF